ncbi:hypothetical protein NUACC21_82160 [Scytonema sp. NUACC21]
MKILMSAYACEPKTGSEPGIGWNIVREVARYHEVWVLTRIAHQAAIEAELSSNPVPNLHFIYFDPFGWTNDWKKNNRGIQLHYYLWQIWAYFVAQRLHRQIHLDFAQHVTYGRYWGFSLLVLLPIPFVLGPVGGGEFTPKTFLKDFSFRGKIYETVRDIVQFISERDPLVRLTAKKTALALATTKETADRLQGLAVKNIQVFSNVGLPEEEIEHLAQYEMPKTESVKFISIGRLLHWKGFHLGLKAFALAKIEKAEYWIVGDGPERQRLEVIAQELGIAEKVHFWGGLPRSETLRKMQESHVLVHPSIHESGGWVCLEMMAAGRTVICLDLGGPAMLVSEETGVKVPAHTPEQAVQDIADAMVRLSKDSELRWQMGQAAKRKVRIEPFSWKAKGQHLSLSYQELFNNV